MRVGVRRLGVVVVLLAALASAAGGGRAAQAQLPPPPEDNPLTPLAPTLSEACGVVNTAVSLIPLAAGLFPGAEVPPELIQLLGPLTTVCAFVPTPPTRSECGLDTDLFLALKPLADSLAVPLLVEPSLAARLTDQLAAIEAAVPSTGPGASELLAGIARCQVPEPVTPVPLEPGDPTGTLAAPVTSAPVPPASVSTAVPSTPALPAVAGRVSPVPIVPAAAPPAAIEPAAPVMPVQLVSGPPPIDHGRYRVLLIAPLVLAGVWFAVARSIAPPLARARAARRSA